MKRLALIAALALAGCGGPDHQIAVWKTDTDLATKLCEPHGGLSYLMVRREGGACYRGRTGCDPVNRIVTATCQTNDIKVAQRYAE
jgi:hypothetical protein